MVKTKEAKDKNKCFCRWQTEVEKVTKVQRKQATKKQKWADSVKAFLVLFNKASNVPTASVTMATVTAVPTIPAVAATMPPTPFTDDDGVEINYDDFECHDGDDLGNVSATMDGDAWRESDDPQNGMGVYL